MRVLNRLTFPPLLAFLIFPAIICSSCFAPGEQNYLPAKAQKLSNPVVLSVITRGGQMIEFNDPGGRMHLRCRDLRDSSCVGGPGMKGDSISLPLDSLTQVTVEESKLDYATTGAVALICLAVGASVVILATHKLTNQ